MKNLLHLVGFLHCTKLITSLMTQILSFSPG